MATIEEKRREALREKVRQIVEAKDKASAKSFDMRDWTQCMFNVLIDELADLEDRVRELEREVAG